MRDRNWHKAGVQERAGSGEVTGRQEVPDGGATSMFPNRSQVEGDLGRILTRLEKSDAFQQRLSTINSEIVRQLGIRKT